MPPGRVTARGRDLLVGLAMAALVAAPVPSAPAPGPPATSPTPTAAELIARMDAALPREGAVVLSGVEAMPIAGYRTYLGAAALRRRVTGQMLPIEDRVLKYQQTISFKPGFYQSHSPGEKGPGWRSVVDAWTIWRADGSLMEVVGYSSDPSNLGGGVITASFPGNLPHELLFQPLRISDWADPARLSLQQTRTHFVVHLTPASSAAASGWGAQPSASLRFPKNGAGGGLPDLIRLTGRRGNAKARLSEFRKFPSGQMLPGRLTYARPGGPRFGRSGVISIKSFSPRFSDGPSIPAIRLQVRDERLLPPLTTQTYLNKAPRPLWLVTMQNDWRQGVIRLPIVGPVRVRQYIPLALPMALLLGMALWQRTRLRAGRAPRARRSSIIRRIVTALRRSKKSL